ncbi:MAG: VWA domain-containing protein [bacterium]|nr:VWA domain-containing protein [bacterium]
MKRLLNPTTPIARLTALALTLSVSVAQTTTREVSQTPTWHGASHVIVPQAQSWSFERQRAPISIERVTASVEILEQAARTTLDVHLHNMSAHRAEAVVLLPVPAHAAITGVDFQGTASEPTARLLPRDEARRTYDDIVRRVKDPALLEFAGYNLVRSSVFPVEGQSRQRVRITYEHVLTADGERVDYVLPRSESLAVQVPWDVSVKLRTKSKVSMVYSPTHDLETLARDVHGARVRIAASSSRNPGPFRLSYLLDKGGVTASLLAYPDPEVGGGYFLLMAGPPSDVRRSQRLLRDVTVVLDRSGSMAGPQMDQLKATASQILEGLDDGEAFNIIDYSSQVASFAARSVIKNRETTLQARAYVNSIKPSGGTNIHDAILEALRQEPRPGMLPIVLFVTDGLPTVGRTSEVEIRERVEKGNPHGKRVFTFGVGNDVNVPLLDRLSDVTRATSTYVLPGEDVEVKVAQVFRRLYGPVLADLTLGALDAGGVPSTRIVRELMPGHLPDLFEGDQLVVLGQYRKNEPLDFRLKGNFLGETRTFAFRFELGGATTRNAFVPRLWATRKIAFLVDQIRQAGAAATGQPLAVGHNIFSDPRLRELSQEILRLSTKFGVLSEYTAFLATEGTDLGNWRDLQAAVDVNLDRRAVRTRSGESAVNQGRNFNSKKVQQWADYNNTFWNDKNERVEVAGVQQIADRAFLKRGGQWIDTNIVAGKAPLEAARIVTLGSPEHAAMLDKLVAQGRQGLLSLRGDILMQYEGQNVLVRNGGQ